MPTYQVTRTETVTVTARNEEQAEELAIEEMQEHPNGDYEIEAVSPAPKFAEIVEALNALGVSAYVDDYKNNAYDFIRMSAVEGHPDDDENHFLLLPSLDDEEEFNGVAYEIYTNDCYTEKATYPAELNTRVMAQLIAKKLREIALPKMVATLEEIAELLTAMGYPSGVESQEWRGMPSYLNIGEHEIEFTLYQNITEHAPVVDGTGYYLSRGEDESDIVLRIPNETAPRVASQIVWAMAQVAKGVTE
jgi:hypothetical protein